MRDTRRQKRFQPPDTKSHQRRECRMPAPPTFYSVTFSLLECRIRLWWLSICTGQNFMPHGEMLMSRMKNAMLASAALAGILAGTSARATAQNPDTTQDTGKKADKNKKEIEKH